MKEIKRRFEHISFYDHARVKAHLERLSEEGWVVEQIGSFFWRYRRSEPKPRAVSITYLPSGSDLNPRLSDEEEDFKAICEGAGWRLACNWMQMQIFYHEDPDAQPVETDPELFVDTVHRSMRKSFLPSYFVLALIMLFYTGQGINSFYKDPISMLNDNFHLMLKLSIVILLVHLLLEPLLYLFWYRRAKRAAAEDGQFLPVPKWHRANQCLLLIAIALDALFFANAFLDSTLRQFFIPLTIVCFLSQFIPRMLQKLLKKRGWSSVSNRVTSGLLAGGIMFAGLMFCGFILFDNIDSTPADKQAAATYEYKGETYSQYDDDLPLTVEDLMRIGKTDDWSKKRMDNRSVFVASTMASQTPRMDRLGQGLPRLEYQITDIPSDFLYDHCQKALLKPTDMLPTLFPISIFTQFEPIDPTPWQAEEAYMAYRDGEPVYEYLICWDNRILTFQFKRQELTPEQISIIIDKLK